MAEIDDNFLSGNNTQNDPKDWLRGLVNENNRHIYDAATIPRLNLGDMLQQPHTDLATMALKQIQEMGDFGLIAQEDKSITIDGKEFNLTVARAEGKINGFILKGADELEMHLLSGAYTGEEQRLEIHTGGIAGEPLHAEVIRVERYGMDAILKNDLRVARLPVGVFATFFPEGWSFEQGDYFQISALIEYGHGKRHVLPLYLEKEPDFDICIFLGNDRKFPRELFRLNAIQKTPEGTYVIGHLGVADETAPEIAFLARMMKAYGEEMLNKTLEYRQLEMGDE